MRKKSMRKYIQLAIAYMTLYTERIGILIEGRV